jgi:TonB family protein
LPEVVEILQQAARGLNAAHKLGIIHRDLKPDNLFLTRGDDGELVVKVVDFGIAKLLESSTHTLTGMVLGTPAYMSYEQASGMRSDELDARSDIYSLGVVVYEMLTGRVPFDSDTPLGYARKHLMEQPPPLRAAAPRLGVPPAVERAVMKSLVKDREQRYASVLDFARELTIAAQPSLPTEAHVPIPSFPTPPPAARQPAAPLALPAEVPAKAPLGAQFPPPARPQRIVKTPWVQPQATKPVAAAILPPAAPQLPQFRTAPKPLRKVIAVTLLGLALLITILVVWNFRRPAPEPPAKENPNPGGSNVGNVSSSSKVGESKAPEVHPPTDSAATIKQLEEMAAQNPRDAGVLLKLANFLYDQKHYSEAVKWYQSELELDPNNVDARTDLGSAYFYMGRPRDCLREYNKALEINPQHESTLLNTIVVNLEGTHDLDGAQRAWDRLNEVNPNHPALAGLKQKINAARASGNVPPPVASPPPPPPQPQTPQRIQVSGQVASARLIFQPHPEYPPLAKMARIQGVVRMDAVIGKDGTIQDLKVISGHPLLVRAALDAVQRWRYQPTLLNGEPVEVATEIDVNFTLAE